MADNRMFLCHRETGEKVLLAKLFGDPVWHAFSPERSLNKFFEDVANKNNYWLTSDFYLEFEREYKKEEK